MPTHSTITLIAAAGLRVPQCDKPSRYITDAAPVTVANNAYYRRRMADGDLREVKAKKETKQSLKTVAAPAELPTIAQHVALKDSQSQE